MSLMRVEYDSAPHDLKLVNGEEAYNFGFCQFPVFCFNSDGSLFLFINYAGKPVVFNILTLETKVLQITIISNIIGIRLSRDEKVIMVWTSSSVTIIDYQAWIYNNYIFAPSMARDYQGIYISLSEDVELTYENKSILITGGVSIKAFWLANLGESVIIRCRYKPHALSGDGRYLILLGPFTVFDLLTMRFVEKKFQSPHDVYLSRRGNIIIDGKIYDPVKDELSPFLHPNDRFIKRDQREKHYHLYLYKEIVDILPTIRILTWTFRRTLPLIFDDVVISVIIGYLVEKDDNYARKAVEYIKKNKHATRMDFIRGLYSHGLK